MLDERSGGYGSDVEKFVANQEDLLERRLEIDPVTDEKIDEAQRKAGERTEQGQ